MLHRRVFRAAALIVSAALLSACARLPGLDRQGLQTLSDEVGRLYAPDKRTAVWEAKALESGAGLVIVGCTDNPQALDELKGRLSRTGTAVDVDMTLLPQPGTAAAQTPWALASVPAATLLSRPAFSASSTTQALLGTPLRVLEVQRPFWRVQTPDGYIGWVHAMQLERLTAAQLSAVNASSRLIVTSHRALLTDEKGGVLMPLWQGSLLQRVGRAGQRVAGRLPDGRIGYVQGSDVRDFNEWLDEREALRGDRSGAFERALIESARSRLGTPYLWGGTSEAGLDCSGFVRLVWRSMGVIVARDADQQIAQSKPVALACVRELAPGLLLAFGRKNKEGKTKVEHIALSLGAGEFIHSLGSVRIESLDPASSVYSAYEAGRYLGAYALDPTLADTPCATGLGDNPFYAVRPGVLEPCRLPNLSR